MITEAALPSSTAWPTWWCWSPLKPGIPRSRGHRAVDPAGERIRRALGDVHHRRVRAHRAAPHARLRHDARTAVRRRGHHSQQRIAKPRSRLLPTRTVHPGRHHRVTADRRAVPSARLRDHLRGRLRAGDRQRRQGRHRQADRSTYWAAARTFTARRISTHRPGIWPAGAAITSTVRSGRTPPSARSRTPDSARRGGRAGTLRPVLVRDHPPAGGVRILRRGRRRTVRRRRAHRHRRQPSRSPPTGEPCPSATRAPIRK